LAIQREIGDLPWLPETLGGLAGVAALRVDAVGAPAAERALRLAGAASAGREAQSGRTHWDAPLAERWLAPAFGALGGRGAPAAEAAWAAGRTMTAEEAIAFALADDRGDESPAPSA